MGGYKDMLLHPSIRNNDEEMVIFLLNNGYEVNVEDIDGNTPLHIAVNNNLIYIIEILLKNGANINSLNKHGDTPLHISIKHNLLKILLLLLDNSADIRIANIDGLLPIDLTSEGTETRRILEDHEKHIALLKYNKRNYFWRKINH